MVNATLQYLEERASAKERFYLFHSFTTPHAGGIGNVSLFKIHSLILFGAYIL